MNNSFSYQIFADIVLAMHAAVVVFVLFGFVLIIIGNVRDWHWVNALSFRLAHLGVVGFVIAEAWLNIVCPLTTLEMWLRRQAGISTHHNSFIEYWLQQLLYYSAPHWVFVLGYSIFGMLTLAVWLYFPPVVHFQGKK